MLSHPPLTSFVVLLFLAFSKETEPSICHEHETIGTVHVRRHPPRLHLGRQRHRFSDVSAVSTPRPRYAPDQSIF